MRKLVILDNKFRLTCNESSLYQKIVMLQNIKIKIVGRLEAFSKNLHCLIKIKQDKVMS